MTKICAFQHALACGALSLVLGGTVYAGVANYTIDPGSSQSNVDNACVGALLGIVGTDCTYNRSYDSISGPPPALGPAFWVGPVWGASYYKDSLSPFQLNPGAVPLPEPSRPDPNNTALAISGSLVIDDTVSGNCEAADILISGRFELEGGTRTFTGGPGTWAEETWSSGTIIYVLPPTEPDAAIVNGSDCEYIFGSDGFPPLLQTLGLTGAGVLSYPVDVDIPNDTILKPGMDQWDTATLQSIGIGSFEEPGAGFAGNIGVEVAIDQTALLDPSSSYSCVDNFGDPANPTIDGACNFSAGADATPCSQEGAHFCAARAVQENWIMKIVVDSAGDIVAPTSIFANNTSIVTAAAPADTDEPNSWDGPVITFTASCDDCALAKNDTYTFVTGTTDPVTLNIGLNDDPSGQLADPTTATIDPPGATKGVCTPSAPGDVTTITCSYASNDGFATAQTADIFTYTLDDGITGAEFGLQGTVSITVEAEEAPLANSYFTTLDSEGVDPASLRETFNAITGIAGNAGGNNTVVSVSATAQAGSSTTIDDEDITYAAGADFFQGTDTFSYFIDDDNFNSPGTTPDPQATAQVTVTIANVSPTATDIEGTLEQGEKLDFIGVITLGNGSIGQHTVTTDCDDTTISGIALNGAVIEVSGTYTAPDGLDEIVECSYTVTDEAGAGDAVNGDITITVTNTVEIKLPGSGSALDPSSLLLLLLFLPLLLSRGIRRRARLADPVNPGV
ncbi:MAG TPA: hypothetical protein QF499_11140 [Gammaproteobacteria bacterium]|nr:hypothetical protein [Gammaproteobacteria bacterium]HJP39664.1 hypothetical protein [Gammaproteobacteria bacterium]